MTTSHKMIYPTKMLYTTFFTAMLAISCTVQAMERQHEGGGQTAHSKKIITLQCSDSKIFKVPYEIVIQSKTIMDFIGNLDNTSIPIPIADSISRETMKTMIDWMELVADAQAKRCSRRNIILMLMETISKSCTDQRLLDYIQAADYLNFKVLLRALCIVLAQRLDPVSGITDFKLNDMFYDVYMCYGVYKSLQKASYLYCHQHLDIDKPVAIELNDLVDFGILDDVTSLNNKLEECIIHLITTFQHQTLQITLNILSKYSNSLSIKAHEVVVAYVRSLTKEQIKELFATLKDHGESTLKMALRLVYAKDFNINLDDLACNYFFWNIRFYVNGFGFNTTPLFSQTYLQYVLLLIEPVTKTLVRELNLSENKLTTLPDSIGNLVNLKELNLTGNNLTSLPDSIGNLVNLKRLYLAANKLTSLPDTIGNLINLEDLNLTCNKLASLPDAIGKLVNLGWLSLYVNKLASLPDSIGNLVKLEWLDLSQNQLTSLPNIIGNLSNLKFLNLSWNKLTTLPDSIDNLSSLIELNLFHNQLTSLPASIDNLVNLTVLYLGNNKLTDEIKEGLKQQYSDITNLYL